MKVNMAAVALLAVLLCGCGGRNSLERYRAQGDEDCAKKVWEFTERIYKNYIGSIDTDGYTGYYDRNKKDWVYYRHMDVVKSGVSKINIDGVDAYIVPVNCVVKDDPDGRYVVEYYFNCAGPEVVSFKRIYKVR